MAAKKVSIVILTYNNYIDTLRCLRALTRVTYPNTEFVFVDNSSTNEAVLRVCEGLRDKRIDYLRLQEGEIDQGPALPNRAFVLEAGANRGYAAGNNLGIRLALARGADYVLLLNNDTVPDPDFLEPMIDYAESHAEVAAVGPRVLEPDGNVSPVTARRRPSIGYFMMAMGLGSILFPSNRWDRAHYCALDYTSDNPRTVDILPGCCLLLKATALATIGLLDEKTFLFWEELILAERLQRAGCLSAVVPESHVVHRHGGSTKRLPSRSIRRFERQSRRYYLQHYRFGNRALVAFLMLASYHPRYLSDDLIALMNAARVQVRSFLNGRLSAARERA